MRRTAKTVNFGIMYGLGSFGLSHVLELVGERQINNRQFFNKYPGLKDI
jgi:DNA polymerase I-like protein with 3'-5' exonuclease and polymerase domains